MLFVPTGNHGSGAEPEEWAAATLLIREVCMLKLVNDLTDKPEWWRKIHDPEIVARWKAEALAMTWQDYRDYADFTPDMVDAVRCAPFFQVMPEDSSADVTCLSIVL